MSKKRKKEFESITKEEILIWLKTTFGLFVLWEAIVGGYGLDEVRKDILSFRKQDEVQK